MATKIIGAIGIGNGLDINMGRLKGYKLIDKFGENPVIDKASVPEDITELGGLYNYDDVGTDPIRSLVSTNATDNQTVSITGLDIDGNEIVQNVTLDGTTRVALSTPLWRVYRMNSANNPTTPLGDIFCYIGTSNTPVDADKRAMITAGNNQTLMAIYTIPKGYVGFLFRGEIGGSRSRNTGAVQGSYYSRRYGQQFAIKKRIAVMMGGSSNYIDNRSFPDRIPALTDIKLTIEDVSNDNIGVFGTLDIMIVDQSNFSKKYLSAIGQPL